MNESCIIEPIPVFGGERRTYQGVAQPFVAHAHDYYVFGIVHEGERALKLNNDICSIHAGSLIVFNPGDVHSCTREFKRRLGTTPAVYREMSRANQRGLPNR